MVGQRPLKPLIGVRIPVSQLEERSDERWDTGIRTDSPGDCRAEGRGRILTISRKPTLCRFFLCAREGYGVRKGCLVFYTLKEYLRFLSRLALRNLLGILGLKY